MNEIMKNITKIDLNYSQGENFDKIFIESIIHIVEIINNKQRRKINLIKSK